MVISCDFGFANSANKLRDDRKLREDIKAKLETTMIDGSTLNGLLTIYPQQNKILELINNFIGNVNVKIVITTFSIKNLIELNNTVSITIFSKYSFISAEVKFKNVKSNNKQFNKQPIEKVKAKLETTLLDGSMLDELLPIELQQDKLLELITNVDANLKGLEIQFTSPKMNLSQTNNIVEVSTVYNYKTIFAKVKFEKIKSYSEKTIDDLISNAKNKIIANKNHLERMIRFSSSKNGIIYHIKEAIKDERITVEVPNLSKVLHEDKFEVMIKIIVMHKLFVDKSKKLKFTLDYEKKYRKDWWYNQSDNNKPNNDQKDVELNENKLNQIYAASFHDLVGIKGSGKYGQIDENDKKNVSKNFRHLQMYFHPDKSKYRFIKEWYEKLKKNISNNNFEKLYSILSSKIFKILEDDVKKIEVVLESLNDYDEKTLTNNEIINKFLKYMFEVSRICIEKRNTNPAQN